MEGVGEEEICWQNPIARVSFAWGYVFIWCFSVYMGFELQNTIIHMGFA
jgi:hypothetical protein